MKGFTLFKRGECPICNGAKKDCRKSDESGMVFCREVDTNPREFIFRGYDKWGFGIWQSSEAAEAFTQKSREERQREQEQQRIENERRRQQQITNQLPAVERDRSYQKILNQLPLNQEDLSELQRRGFTSEQIQADGYRSVEQWQRVDGSFPVNLPGLLGNGSLNSQPGIIFPVRDVENRIVALSIRLRDGSNGRYRWSTSATKKNPDAASPHLNAELPLSIFEPEENQGDAIWLAEGVGIKPSLTRYRLGSPVVGASSGLFSASPNTCKTTLEKLTAKYRTQKLIVAVDAGDVQNSHVCQRWASEFEFLRSLGYKLQIAWWGQVTKEHPDIDELDDLSKVEYISPEDFLLWAGRGETHRNVSTEAKKGETAEAIRKLSNSCKIKSSKDGQWQSEQEEIHSSSSQNHTNSQYCETQLTASNTIQHSTATTLQEASTPNIAESKLPRLNFNCFKEANPEFEEKIRQVQRKLRSLSYQADIQLNERYLPSDLVYKLPKSGLIGIKAPKGCGKSVSLKRIIAEAKKQEIPVLSITPRIALGREQAIKWEITWIDDYGTMQTRAENTTAQIREIAKKMETAKEKLAELEQINCQLNLLGEDETEKLERQKQSWRVEIERYAEEIENVNAASIRTLALCWDSLWRTKDRDLKNGLIIIDEAELGFKHFVSGSTCKRNRPYLLQVFKEKLIECLMSGGRVILSDADLTDLPINYIRQILPIPINPFIVVSEYIGEETRWIIDFRTGSRGNTLTDTLEKLKDGSCLAFTCDSQAEAQALEKLILQELPDNFCPFLDADGEITHDARSRKKALIVRIDSSTTETKAGKKFIQKPNEQILHWQPRLLIYTPSMGVGVSIDESTQRWDEEWEVTIPYFDALIGSFFGVIEPSQCRQQLSRIRANIPRIVWCKESNHALEGCSSFFPNEIKRQTLKYNHSALNILDIAKGIAGYEADDEEIREAMFQVLNEAWDKNSRCWKEPSIDLASAFKARENYGLWNLANLLREELEDEGHTIISLEGVKSDLVEQMALIKDDQKMEEATQIAESPSMPVEEAKKTLNKLGATKNEHRSAQKTLLQEELPGVNLTPALIKKAVIDNRRRWLNEHKLFWYLKNDEALKQIDTDHWLSNLKKFAQGTPFMRDIRSYSPKVEALKKSGIFSFIDLEDCDRIYQHDTPEAQTFLKRCLEQRELLQTNLNVLVTKKSSPIGLANRILGKVGLALEKLTRSHKDTRWKLSADLVSDPDRANVLKAFELRWQMSQEQAAQKLAENQPQTQSQTAIQPGGQLADYIYTNQTSPPNLEELSQSDMLCSDLLVLLQQNSEAEGVDLASQNQPQTQSEQATQPGGQSADYIYTNQTSPPIVEELSQEVGLTPVEELAQALQYADAPDVFAAAIEGYTQEQIEDAIAVQGSQPIRQELMRWYEAGVTNDTASSLSRSEKPICGVSENTSKQLPFASYKPGEQVWAYFPQSQDKWLKATVEWVRGNTIRVVSGLFGMFVEEPELIAPGHWELVM
jgi:hypothetical protein